MFVARTLPPGEHGMSKRNRIAVPWRCDGSIVVRGCLRNVTSWLSGIVDFANLAAASNASAQAIGFCRTMRRLDFGTACDSEVENGVSRIKLNLSGVWRGGVATMLA